MIGNLCVAIADRTNPQARIARDPQVSHRKYLCASLTWKTFDRIDPIDDVVALLKPLFETRSVRIVAGAKPIKQPQGVVLNNPPQ